MLKNAARLAAVMLLAALTFAGLTAPATAADCVVHNPAGGTYVVACSNPGSPGGGGSGGGADRECYMGDDKIPCTSSYGTWDGRFGWIKVLNPQPPESDSAWDARPAGETGGYLVEYTLESCIDRGIGGGVFIPDCGEPGYRWYPSGDPSPEEVAEEVVAAMQLTMGEIGSTPPSLATKPDSMGVVGVPMWLWVANPLENTTGPFVASDNAGSLTVTVTARLDRIEWSYTNRHTGAVVHTVTCAGDSAPGTPWSDAIDGDGSLPSPNCGLDAAQNDAVGEFTLTGTAYWVADWEAGTESGTIDVEPQSRAVEIDVAELQAIVTS
jgi:hypothetical protein